MATRFKVTVYDSRISGLFDPGGDANEFARDINRDTLYLAMLYVPKRSMELANSHKNLGVLKSGRYNVRGTVAADARHAVWVHEGTIGTRIIPLHSFAMPIPFTASDLPVRQGGRRIFLVGPAFRKKSVAGQEAYPWLDMAGQQAVRRVTASYRVRGGV
jgi:hypothetical protein